MLNFSKINIFLIYLFFLLISFFSILNFQNQKEPLIVFVFQEPTLMPWRNVLSNVVLPIEIRHNKNHFTKDYALEWLERVGLNGKGK